MYINKSCATGEVIITIIAIEKSLRLLLCYGHPRMMGINGINRANLPSFPFRNIKIARDGYGTWTNMSIIVMIRWSKRIVFVQEIRVVLIVNVD